MQGAFFACAAATNFVQWSLRATSTGSTLMPGLAASNSAMVAFHTGSYCDSVRFAVCHCRMIGCWADAVPNARQAAMRVMMRMGILLGDALPVQRARPLGARLRAERHLLQRVEVRLDAESRAL